MTKTASFRRWRCKKVTFEDTDMGDGQFMFMFEMTDVQNNTATSQIVTIEVKDGEALYSN